MIGRESKKLQSKLKLLKLDLKRDADNPTVHYALATTLAELASTLARTGNDGERAESSNYREQALTHFDQAIMLSNYEQPLYLAARAQLHEELGNEQLAIEDVIAAASLPQQDGSIGRYVGDISKAIGQRLVAKIRQLVEQGKVSAELAGQFSAFIIP